MDAQPANPSPASAAPPADLTQMLRSLADAWDAPDLPRTVRIVYNRRLATTLGRALLDEGVVELNPRLLAEHPDQLWPTLAHEAAHLLVRSRYGPRTQPHGREFRTLMRAVNLSPKATHNLPVAHLRRNTGRYLYIHRCSTCGQTFTARKPRRDLYCKRCGPDSEWNLLRLPNNPAGARLANRFLQNHHSP